MNDVEPVQDRMTAWRATGVWAGVELCQASYRRHHFPVHAHHDVHVGVIDSGCYRFTCDGVAQIAEAGDLVILAPDAAHDGGAADATGYSYRQALIPPALWSGVTAHDGIHDGFHRRTPVWRHLPTARLLRAAFAAQEQRDALLFDAALARMIASVSEDAPGWETRERITPGMLTRVMDMMRADIAEPWTLAGLAAAVGSSRFVLSRSFRQNYGLGLHDWLMDLRLRQARRWLAAGMPAAEVASACGFADQSHLARRFKRGYGVTPGQFAASCTSVQA